MKDIKKTSYYLNQWGEWRKKTTSLRREAERETGCLKKSNGRASQSFDEPIMEKIDWLHKYGDLNDRQRRIMSYEWLSMIHPTELNYLRQNKIKLNMSGMTQAQKVDVFNDVFRYERDIWVSEGGRFDAMYRKQITLSMYEKTVRTIKSKVAIELGLYNIIPSIKRLTDEIDRLQA